MIFDDIVGKVELDFLTCEITLYIEDSAEVCGFSGFSIDDIKWCFIDFSAWMVDEIVVWL